MDLILAIIIAAIFTSIIYIFTKDIDKHRNDGGPGLTKRPN